MKEKKRSIVSTFNVTLTKEEFEKLNYLKYRLKVSNTAKLVRELIDNATKVQEMLEKLENEWKEN